MIGLRKHNEGNQCCKHNGVTKMKHDRPSVTIGSQFMLFPYYPVWTSNSFRNLLQV